MLPKDLKLFLMVEFELDKSFMNNHLKNYLVKKKLRIGGKKMK